MLHSAFVRRAASKLRLQLVQQEFTGVVEIMNDAPQEADPSGQASADPWGQPEGPSNGRAVGQELGPEVGQASGPEVGQAWGHDVGHDVVLELGQRKQLLLLLLKSLKGEDCASS